MFGWFRPTCPLATGEKVWVESRMAWLAQNLGMDRMLQAPVVEPTEEYFPDEYQGETKDAEQMFLRVARLMQIDPARVTMEVRTDWTAAGEHPLGRYNSGNPAHIEVNPSQLHDPESLAATLAHELATKFCSGAGYSTTTMRTWSG